MTISLVVAPAVGAIIGYITNDIAIRMLFRPHKAKHIFGMHIPFTPGIIPKEKGRIANSIGNVISENLMNSDVLGRYLLSEPITNKLRSSITDFFEAQKRNEETVEQFLFHYLTEDEISNIAKNINNNLTSQIKVRLSDESVGDKVAHIAVEHVINNMSSEDSEHQFANIAGMPRRLVGGIFRMILAALHEPAERMLSRNINDILKNSSEEIVSNLIGKEMTDLMDTPVKDLLNGKGEQIHKIIEKAISLYRNVITEHLPRILETVNISEIVSDRINEMDVAEAEKIILQVMKNELRAIVWLGAGLGSIMGIINIII